MEWRVVTRGGFRKGIDGLLIIPAEGHKPTHEEWEAMKNIVEQAVKKASGRS
jgi:hypothetical protein